MRRVSVEKPRGVKGSYEASSFTLQRVIAARWFFEVGEDDEYGRRGR